MREHAPLRRAQHLGAGRGARARLHLRRHRPGCRAATHAPAQDTISTGCRLRIARSAGSSPAACGPGSSAVSSGSASSAHVQVFVFGKASGGARRRRLRRRRSRGARRACAGGWEAGARAPSICRGCRRSRTASWCTCRQGARARRRARRLSARRLQLRRADPRGARDGAGLLAGRRRSSRCCVEVADARLLADGKGADAAARRIRAWSSSRRCRCRRELSARSISASQAARQGQEAAARCALAEFTLRDGDSVEILGYKSRTIDPTVATRLERDTPFRATLRGGRMPAAPSIAPRPA